MDQQTYSNALFFIGGLDRRYKINRKAGWVYIAHNRRQGASVVKIGMTSRSPTQRASELKEFSGVPGRFELAYFVHTADRYEVEKYVHRKLDQYRMRSWEEFFELRLPLAVDALDEAAEQYPLWWGCPGNFRIART